jgi:hypothetical protein
MSTVLMKLRSARGDAVVSRLVTVAPIEFDGVRYVVAARGPSGWVRSLRATKAVELLGRLGRGRFRAVEVDGAERERVVSAYRKQLGRAVKDCFERLPNAADHPTFRLEPAFA